jgi:hypothetical protein
VRLFSFLTITAGIVLLWFYCFGFEGLKIISSRNQEYAQLSLNDPSNPFYMKTGVYSICAGWCQNLLTFSGNTLISFGFHILEVLPLITIPFFLIIYGLKKSETSHRIYLKIIFFLTFSSLIYATILSLISGHIISFHPTYSIFSTPYFVILIGISIFLILKSTSNKIQYIFKTLMVLQLFIMAFSIATVYCGFDSSFPRSDNYYEILADKIKTIHSTEANDFIITYKEAGTAIEMNKYLGGSLTNIKQVIHKSESDPAVYLFFPKNHKIISLE